MALSMVVLIIPVLLLVFLYRFLGNETPPTIDASSAYDSARRANLFQVVTPEGLPKDWRITNAGFREQTLRIGILTGDGGAVQIVETAAPADTVVPVEVGPSARPGDRLDVAGASWQRYSEGRNGHSAVVLATPGRTVVIVGKASDGEFRTLAGSLR